MLLSSDWESLIALRKYKNITTTASILFISQPALTKRIEQIESEMGVAIVERTVKGVIFTPQGEELVRYAKARLEEYEQLKKDLKSFGEIVSGTVKIGATRSLVEHTLPDLLKSFKDTYPNVEFELYCSDNFEVMQGVYNQQYHIGFVREKYPWNLKSFAFRTEYAYVLSLEKLDIKNLPYLQRIAVEKEGYIQNQMYIENWWHDYFDKPEKSKMIVPSGSACVEMVRRGLGYGILLDKNFYKGDDLYSAPLFFKDGRPLSRNDYIVYHDVHSRTGVVNLIVDFSRDYFKKKPD